MNNKLSKIKCIAMFIAGITATSVPVTASADWSIIDLSNTNSVATGINDSGEVVGNFTSASGYTHAFITGPNGMGMTDLGNLGGSYSSANGINDSGQVVGSAVTEYYYSHAFITGPNGIGMTDLGTLGGTTSFAEDINDSGQVVGGADAISFSHEYSHAFITGPNGIGMTDLGTLGGKYSFANGINDSGEVVGLSYIIGDSGLDNFHSYIFSHGGMTDLNLLDTVVAGGWSHLYVTDINNHGQIVGYGVHNGFSDKAFLLTYTQNTIFTPNPVFIPPVPEPETFAMLLAGLGLLGFMAHRRKESEA